ncbi:MAG: DUF1501 domain-containing protein, partial [Planctomycetes bacterium]|nr:DUF1501 domain-containing protein [Planctomycetota bacterium]
MSIESRLTGKVNWKPGGSGPCTRRQLFKSAGRGLGSLLAAGLLAELIAADDHSLKAVDPLAPKMPHFAPRAKRVIFLYMSGGASHLETFDPKPQLAKDHGKTMVPGEGREFAKQTVYLERPRFQFRAYGRSGLEVSELFPHVGGCADDICLIRSMRADHINHYEGALGLHTGSFNFTRPSIGSWLSYGLGTENRNLPSVVVIAPVLPYAGPQLWAADFLPGYHQGTRVIPGPTPIPNLGSPASVELQALELEMLGAVNRKHLQKREADSGNLAARIKSFETAFGMQIAAPEVFDLSLETDATLRLYGLERGST